ncbi:MAG: radical SAM protein [Elusimicrobiota bacterium]|nr:radical SAM protein [Elusimicrobiota bacterium]
MSSPARKSAAGSAPAAPGRLPAELDICVSNQCNMHCRYCYSGDLDRAHAQKLDLRRMKLAVLHYLRAARGGKVEKISISGGEPLLDKKLLAGLLPWLRKAVGPGVEIECFSNGLLLDAPTAGLFRRSAIHLKISLDGASFSHNLNRVTSAGRPSFRRVIRNIRALPAAARKALGISTTVTKATAPRLAENVRFLASLGAGDLGLSFAVQEAWSARDLAALRRELRKAALYFKGAGRGAFAETPKFGYKRLGKGRAWLEHFCAQGEVSIGPDGVFYPCSIISASRAAQDPALRAAYAVGDWRSGLDLEKVRASRERAFSAVMASGQRDFLACLLCIYYKNLLEPGDLKALLKSSADIVSALRSAGMGSDNPDLPPVGKSG